MTAFAYGFRDTLEAALVIGLAVALLVRLNRAGGVNAVWAGAGAGALFGFAIGTGLAAGNIAADGAGWQSFELASMGLSVAALVGLAFASRRFPADAGPCLWLGVACGLFAALPQTINLLTHVAANEGSALSLALMALGAGLAAGLAALLALGLARVKLGQPLAGPEAPAAGELAPVRQRVD